MDNHIISLVIPEGIIIQTQEKKIWVEGPLAKSQKLTIPTELEIQIQEKKILISSKNLALLGTYKALLFNDIKGVLEPYQQILEIKGNYKASMKNSQLEVEVGKSHLDYIDIPSDLEVILKDNKTILIKGVSKQRVNWLAACIRRLRKPSAYQNKGIYYAGEEFKLKPGKSLNK